MARNGCQKMAEGVGGPRGKSSAVMARCLGTINEKIAVSLSPSWPERKIDHTWTQQVSFKALTEINGWTW